MMNVEAGWRSRSRVVPLVAVLLLLVAAVFAAVRLTVERAPSGRSQPPVPDRADTGHARTTPGFPSTPTTYRGHEHGVSPVGPTAEKPQSKLWHADGTWWAVMVNPASATMNVYERAADHVWRDTGVTVDDRISYVDVLFADGRLYVASADQSALRVTRLTFDAGRRGYRTDEGFPVEVGDGGADCVTIALAADGRLWITFQQRGLIQVAHSLGDQRSWTAPFVPAVAGVEVSADDISSVVTLDGKIGLMWSDQQNDAFRFALHEDGAPDQRWTAEVAVQGPGWADDHLHLTVGWGADQGRLFAVVKTSFGDAGEPATSPRILVLTRSASGTWAQSVVSTVAEGHTRPIGVLDGTNRELYVLTTTRQGGGTIVYKKASTDTLEFAEGPGREFLSAPYVNNVTATKSRVTADTGMVVMASSSSEARRWYYHAELGLGSQG